jgi:Protein of unknown function (DUF998)
MCPRNRIAGLWASITLVGVVVNLVVLVVMPALRPDLNLLDKSLSYYAIGPWGVLQAIAFGALGIASIALGAALQASIASRWVWLIVILLTLSGIASLGLVWYPIDAPGPAQSAVSRSLRPPSPSRSRLEPNPNGVVYPELRSRCSCWRW